MPSQMSLLPTTCVVADCIKIMDWVSLSFIKLRTGDYLEIDFYINECITGISNEVWNIT